jgi:hypothetical protein
MTKTFTYDDVVRYLYAETTENENELIVEAMALDDNLMNFYLDTLEIQTQMNKISKTPSDKTIAEVFTYSKQYSSKRPAALLY